MAVVLMRLRGMELPEGERKRVEIVGPTTYASLFIVWTIFFLFRIIRYVDWKTGYGKNKIGICHPLQD